MGGGDQMLIGLAAVALGVKQHAIGGADVRALMAVAARALANQKIAQFAEIVAPRIGEVFRRRFIEYQRLVVELAVILRALLAHASDDAAPIAVAPRHEGLRLYVSWRISDRKPDVGIDMVIGAARQFSPAAVLDQIARTVKSEVRFGRRPGKIDFRLLNFRRRAAGGVQQAQKSQRNRIGLLASQVL